VESAPSGQAWTPSQHATKILVAIFKEVLKIRLLSEKGGKSGFSLTRKTTGKRRGKVFP